MIEVIGVGEIDLKFRFAQQMQNASAQISAGMQTQTQRGLPIHPFDLLFFVKNDHAVGQGFCGEAKAIQS